MNGLITVGLPGSPIQFLTSGLGPGGDAPPPSPITNRGSMLYRDIPRIILSEGADEDISLSFPLPVGSTKLTYTFSGTVSDVDLLGSLDGTHFSVLANQVAEGSYEIQTNVTFIAARVNTGEDVEVTVVAKRERL